MNFYDVLAAKNWDGGIPTINFFDLLFAQSMGGAEQWETYEGTLPATLNANGDDMRQYQIYGATGGVGDKTVNVFDAEISVGSIDNTNGTDDNTTRARLRSGFLSTALSAGTYTINASGIDDVVVYKYDAEKNFIGVETFPRYWETLPRVITLSSATFVRFVFRHSDNRRCYTSDISNIMLTPGTTPPETFVPFGYEMDVSTSDGTNTATAPIYIGDEPLDKDEYADYQSQKVYRMINGVLTPTDPPVALPALPTAEGATIIDYAGQSAAPEKVVFEYKKGGD